MCPNMRQILRQWFSNWTPTPRDDVRRFCDSTLLMSHHHAVLLMLGDERHTRAGRLALACEKHFGSIPSASATPPFARSTRAETATERAAAASREFGPRFPPWPSPHSPCPLAAPREWFTAMACSRSSASTGRARAAPSEPGNSKTRSRSEAEAHWTTFSHTTSTPATTTRSCITIRDYSDEATTSKTSKHSLDMHPDKAHNASPRTSSPHQRSNGLRILLHRDGCALRPVPGPRYGRNAFSAVQRIFAHEPRNRQLRPAGFLACCTASTGVLPRRQPTTYLVRADSHPVLVFRAHATTAAAPTVPRGAEKGWR